MKVEQIEVTVAFDATHEHIVPPGVMSERHRHDWLWTVRLVGEPHPIYGWVADFNDVEAAMVSAVKPHYEGTAECILGHLVVALRPRLSHRIIIAWARLEETPRRAAVWEVPHA